MNIQPWMVIDLLVLLSIGTAVFLIKDMRFRVGLIVASLLIASANPFRFEQEGVAKLERASYEEVEIPERVRVEVATFEESQALEFEKMKEQSQEIHREIK